MRGLCNMKQLIYNAIILNEDEKYHGYVEVSENGIIENVGRDRPAPELINKYGNAAINIDGNWLMPGVIDSHVHFREPGGEHKATIYTESRAAVAGGVTSFIEMPNTSPATTSLEALQDKFERASRSSMANYSFYIGATSDNIEVLKAIDYSHVAGVKLFMGSSTGGMLVNSTEALGEIFKLRTLIAVHCEDESIIKNNTQAVKELYKTGTPGIEWHPQIRNVLACCKSTATAIELAKQNNTRLHIMHLTTAPEVDMLAQTPDNVTGEVCVAHLWFDDSDYSRLGSLIKCNPAIKSAINRQALYAALNDGIISTVSTDHAPHTIDEKSGTLFTAPSGMPMIQFSLPVMFSLAKNQNWTPTMVVRYMCHNQADTLGIVNRGYIRQGYAADLVQVSPHETTFVSKDTILSKCGWSPLEGNKLSTKVKRTWVNGEIVYTDTVGIIESARNAQQLLFCNRDN